jgi:hypothetical protein
VCVCVCVCMCLCEVYQATEVCSNTLVVRRHKSGGRWFFVFVYSVNIKI